MFGHLPSIRIISKTLLLSMALGGFLATPATGVAQNANESSSVREPTAAEVQQAREWFTEGLELSDRNSWREAVDRFRRVRRIRDTAAVRYNLAYNLKELGEFSEAEELLQLVVDDPEAGDLVTDANRVLTSIRSDAGTIAIRVNGDPNGVFVTLNERELTPERLATTIHVRPGRHTVAAERGDQEIARESVVVGRGGAETVTLQIAPTPAEVAQQHLETPTENPALPCTENCGNETTTSSRKGVWIGVTIALLAVTGGIIFAATQIDSNEPFQGDFVPGQVVVP